MSLGVKRLFDIVVSTTLLVLLLPVLIAASVAVRATSPGPIFFSQTRHGLLSKPITVLKFRTLYYDRSDAAGVVQALPGDSRITPVGRFLRRTSIDELPQLINVLRGDMSLVGPRPHPFDMIAAGVPYERLVPYYRLRHLARPGLTGWAQANGLRGPTVDPALAKARIDHDIAYVQNYSVWLDMRALWLTATREIWRMAGG
ncbi:sugar transferase [Devosia sp. MC521]|nr:sugar transferase [Devosia sp. MC521]QMW64452.1 sugar transferase [Devosia sp. MC521]